MQIINEKHQGGASVGGDDREPKEERLMPRTKDLPIYSVAELNDKVSSPKNADLTLPAGIGAHHQWFSLRRLEIFPAVLSARCTV